MAVNKLLYIGGLMKGRWCVLIIIISLSLVGCTNSVPPTYPVGDSAISLTSDAFTDGGTIPQKYTCRGDNISPPLKWDGVPSATKSLALIMEDADAPIKDFTHWVVFNIMPDTREFSEAISSDEQLSNCALQGVNGAKQIGYFGPCPPPGGPHRYNFVLYALDTILDLDAGASKEQVLSAMEGHIIEKDQLVGLFQQ